MQKSFLVSYIEDHSPSLEDIISDSDFLQELQLKDAKLLGYLQDNFDEILNYIITEPGIGSDSKRNFSLPYIASEILSLNIEEIADKLFCGDNPKAMLFFNYLNTVKISLLYNSTLPGYIYKVITKNINHFPTKFADFVHKRLDEVLSSIKRTIQCDSVSDILLYFVCSCMNEHEYRDSRLKILRFIREHLIETYYLLSESSISPEIKSNDQGDAVENILKIYMKLMKVLAIVESDEAERKLILLEIFNSKLIEAIEKYLLSKSIKEIDLDEKRICIVSILFISSSLVNLSNKDVFVKYRLENILTMFLFDEVNELNLKLDNVEDKSNKSVSYNNNMCISDEKSEEIITESIIPIYQKIANIAKLSKGQSNTFETTYEKLKISPVSQIYLLYIDISILLIVNRIVSFNKVLHESNLLESIMSDFNYYHHNSFLLNKIVKIFEIINEIEEHNDYLNRLLESDKNGFDKIIQLFNKYEFINLEEKKFNNKNFHILNSAQSFKLIQLLYEWKDKKEANVFHNDLAKLLDENKENFLVFQEVVGCKLTQDIQPLEDLKQSEDDGFKEDIKGKFNSFTIVYENESYYMTTKKQQKTSKEVSQTLKNLDI